MSAQDFVAEELSSIIKEFGVPAFTQDEADTLDQLERELNKDLANGEFPMAVLLRIRRIYSAAKQRRKKR